ncbi:MAG: hypothetical protein RL294_447, partial [Actinomycetota bacterium]
RRPRCLPPRRPSRAAAHKLLRGRVQLVVAQPTPESTCGVTRHRAAHQAALTPTGRMNAPSLSTGSVWVRRHPRVVVDRRPSAISNRFNRGHRSSSSNRRDGRSDGSPRIFGAPPRPTLSRADCWTTPLASDFPQYCIDVPLETVLGRRVRVLAKPGGNSASHRGHKHRRATRTPRRGMFEFSSSFFTRQNLGSVLRAGGLLPAS